jgi:succinyldiaminopimelate transaminase
VDVSVGTPVDATPAIVQQALIATADAPGYPTTAGTTALREACAGWMQRRLGVTVPSSAILPSIGSKELVANLPTVLGLGADSHVVVPLAAYPTYAVGAGVLGARVTATDRPQDVSDADLIWINSPGNPTGRVMPAEQMREIVAHARSIGAVVASDECYVELGWDATPCSVLHPSVVGDDHSGVLALHSLSKRSNFAGYRFGFVAGDPDLIQRMLGIRKHLGMMVPSPVQAAAAAAFDDDEHVAVQRARYFARREILRAALLRSGFTIDHSEAGLYLWATRGEPCWETVGWFAECGILVTPGDFYGAAGAHHVRVALTATDEAVAAFAGRLSVR